MYGNTLYVWYYVVYHSVAKELFEAFSFIFLCVLFADISCPSIESFENVMRLSGMTVQALWDTESVFMQLPHIGPNVLKHFYTKKVRLECPLKVPDVK